MNGLKAKFKAMSEGKAAPAPIMAVLGMRIVQFEEGRVVLTMNVENRFYNPMGSLHGGVMADLADAAMGIAMISTLNESESFTTLEFKMNFLRPVYKGEITAEAKVLHRGRRVTLVESVLRNSEGKDVARGIATQMVLSRQS